MRLSRSLGIACLALAAPIVAHADKKADEERKKINPPLPYKLYVGGMEEGAKDLRGVFAEKDAGKKWRREYERWFALVPKREEAEVAIEVTDKGGRYEPGYVTMYFIVGRLTIRGMVKDVAVRGEDVVSPFRGLHEERVMLDRIIRYMRDAHKDAVLAHGLPRATARGPSRPQSVPSPSPPSAKGPQVEEDNETYGYWERFKPGSWVVRKYEGTLNSETKEILKSISPSEVVLEVRKTTEGLGRQPPKREIVPRRVKVDVKAKGWKEGEESVEIAGQRLQCRTQRSKKMKRWYCPEVPGGFARMEWEEHGKLVQRVLATGWEAKR